MNFWAYLCLSIQATLTAEETAGWNTAAITVSDCLQPTATRVGLWHTAFSHYQCWQMKNFKGAFRTNTASAPVRNSQFCNGRSDDPLRPAANVFQLLVPVAVHVNWTPEFIWKQILCCQSNTTVFLHLDTATCCGCYRLASGQLCKAF
jgi:hypothetical protein